MNHLDTIELVPERPVYIYILSLTFNLVRVNGEREWMIIV